jgi:hypothetical protein
MEKFLLIFSFSDKFPLSPVNKTIHSEMRGNLLLKTDKIVTKWRDFYHEVLLISFEMAEIKHKFRVKSSFFLGNLEKITWKTE